MELCKIFRHKWTYYKLYETNQHIRHCKRCNQLQYRKWHMTSYIWSIGIEYTKLGAEKHVEGYGE